MGKIFAELDDKLRNFIEARQMFFVATAPLAGDGPEKLKQLQLEGNTHSLDGLPGLAPQ